MRGVRRHRSIAGLAVEIAVWNSAGDILAIADLTPSVESLSMASSSSSAFSDRRYADEKFSCAETEGVHSVY